MTHAEYTAAATARQYIVSATDCQRTQDDLKLTMGNAETAISRLEDERDRLAAELAAAREQRRLGHHHLKTLIKENAQHLDEAIARKNERAERLKDLGPRLARRIEADLRAALPHTPESLTDLDRLFAVAEGRVRDARVASELRAERAQELTVEIGQLRREPKPTVADSELVSDARARDLPRKATERPGLAARAAGIQRGIDHLETEHEHLVSRIRRETSQVRRKSSGTPANQPLLEPVFSGRG